MRLRSRALKPLVVAVSIACLSLVGCSEQESTAKEGEVQQLLSRAHAYQLQGQYRAAVIEAKNALQKDPKSADAYVLIAKIYSDLGDSKQALALLEKTNLTSNSELYIAHIEALVERGKAQTALELIAKPPADLSPEQKETLQLSQARAMVLSGEFSKASELFKQLSASSNETMRNDASTGLAAIAFEANKISEANSILDELLLKSPSYTDALVLKAAIAYKNKELDKSEELLSQALVGLPNTDLLTAKRATVLDSLVNVLTLQGRTAEAMVYTKMLAEARPGAETAKALFEEAIALFKSGKYKESEQKLLQIYNDNNAPDAAGRLLGIIRMQEGDLSGAEQYFTQHIDPETANPEVLRLLAENQLRQNKSAEALHLIEENLNKSPDDPDLLSVYGLAALAEGEVEKGVAAIEKVLKIQPERTKLRAALADYYLRAGDAAASLEQLRKAIEQSPKDFELRAQLIRELFFLRKVDDAKAQATELAKLFADNAEALSIAGSALLQLKEFEQAKQAFDKSLAIDANNISSLIGNALLSMGKQQWEDARKSAFKALDVDPNSIRAFKLLAAMATQTGAVDSYIKQLQEMSQSKINAWGPDVSLAEYHLSRGNFEKALEHSKEALARSGFKGYAKELTARIYLQLARRENGLKNITETRRYLMEGLQTNPDDIEMLDMLAHVEINADKFTEVDKIIAQIKESHPKSTVPMLIEADKLRKQGNKAEALSNLQKLWAEAPSDAVAVRIVQLLEGSAREAFATEWKNKLTRSAEAQIYLAIQQQGKGNIDAAITGYEDALKLSPNDPRALNNLAWILFERKQVERALILSEKAATLSPNDPAILDTHGWILFNSGNKEKAEPILKRAAELAPNIQEIQDHYQAVVK